MNPKIIVAGSVNLDVVLRTAHLPAPGETVAGRSLDYVPGGKGANQAVAAARLGGNVAMVARVGDDPFGEPMRRNLAENGVDTAHVTLAAGTPQGIAVILVDDAGQNSIVLAAGANGALNAPDVEAAHAAFDGARIVLLQNEVGLDATVAAARAAKAAGATVLWNPAPAPDAVPQEMIGLADILLPNETEAERLSGIPATTPDMAKRAANALVAMGFPAVVVTLGGEGAVWVDRHEALAVPAFPVEVVDTTAAGDTFAGALAVALGEGKPKANALRFACGAAALAVTKLGAQAGIPTREALETFLAAH